MFPNDFSFCEIRDWVRFIFVLWGPRKLLVHHCRCIKCLLISSWGDEILSHSPLSTGRCSYQWEWPNSVLCFKDISSHMNKIYGAKRSPDWCGSSRTSPWMQSLSTLVLFILMSASSWPQYGCQDLALSSLEGRKSQGQKVCHEAMSVFVSLFVLQWAAPNILLTFHSPEDSHANSWTNCWQRGKGYNHDGYSSD